MKRTALKSSILLFIFLIIFLFILNRRKNLTDLERAYISQPVAQPIKTRVWKEIEFKKVATSEELINSISMRFGPDGLIYISDNDQLVIKRYNLQADLVDSLGAGEGRGPGEFLSVFVTMVDPLGRAWVSDSDNGRITILYPNDKEKWDIINPPAIPIGVMPIDSGKYVIDEFIYGTLAIYSSEHERIAEFEPFLKDPKPWIIIMQGDYAVAQDYSIVKAFNFTNNLIRYSKEGEIIYFRKPIDPPPLAPITPSPESNDAGVHENVYDFLTAEQFTSSLSLVKDKIHLLISRKMEQSSDSRAFRTKKFVDVYDFETGNYLYSYNLPEPVGNFSVSETHLAATSEELGKLVIWEVDGGWK